MIGHRALTAAYWVAGILLAILAGVAGAGWGNSQAPTFSNDDKGGTPATGASRLMFSVFGGLLAAGLVLAFFAAVFMFLWVRSRRAHSQEDEDYFEPDDSLMDEMEFGDQPEDPATDFDNVRQLDVDGSPRH